MAEITLRSPLDMHIHFREGAMLSVVAPLSAYSFAGGVVMPNLVPPVDNQLRLTSYRAEVDASVAALGFAPYMTLFMRSYTREELVAAKPHILGVKLYPAGATTNSDGGVRGLESIYPTLALMEELGIPLMVHGETNGFVMDRERDFLIYYRAMAEKFPSLQITMEHITTKDAVQFLDQHANIRATVTLQHLVITLDDVAGGLLDPHLFCKPIAKRPEDRDALLKAALEAHPKLMFGSDSAPHPRHKKECSGCAAGVFTAPIILPVLADLFSRHGKQANLQAFVSDNARRLYGVNPPAKTVVLHDQPMQVPAQYGEVVPMYAGMTLPWSIKSVEQR